MPPFKPAAYAARLAEHHTKNNLSLGVNDRSRCRRNIKIAQDELQPGKIMLQDGRVVVNRLIVSERAIKRAPLAVSRDPTDWKMSIFMGAFFIHVGVFRIKRKQYETFGRLAPAGDRGHTGRDS